MNPITVSTTINAPVADVWERWNEPAHITKWNFASDDWECPHAENDLKVGGTFTIAMTAKDKSEGFDFEGTYTAVVPNELIEYEMSDGRKVRVEFEEEGETTRVTETFDPETKNTRELQQQGWQAILNNFKKYVENNSNK